MHSFLTLTISRFLNNDLPVMKIFPEFITQPGHVEEAADDGIIFTDNRFVLPVFNGVKHIWGCGRFLDSFNLTLH